MTRQGVMTVGYQGFGNVGDEAILGGIERLLADSSLRVMAVAGGPEAIPAFPAATRVRMHRLLPGLAALRQLRRRRALLFAGGGLLHDHWPTVIPSYLAWTVLARLLGMRVGWLAVGIGPLRHGWSRLLTRLTLRLANVVTVRDPASAELAARVAPGVAVQVVPDPAIFNDAPAEHPGRQGIGMIVRGPAPAGRARAAELAEQLGGAAAAHGAVLITLAGPADRAFAEAVAAAAERAGGSRPSMEELSPDPRAALARLAGLEAVISVRLHGVILGALAGTPAVGIAYDPKVAAWTERLGSPMVGLDEVEPATLTSAIEAASRPDARERVAARVDGLRAEAAGLRRLLESALN